MIAEVVKVLDCGGELFFAEFTPDGETIVTGGIKPPTLWNVRTGKKERVLTMQDWANCIAFSKHSHLMALGTAYHQKVKIWNTQSWKHLKDFSGYKQAVVSVSLDDAGRFVASCTEYGQIIVWDVRRKRRAFTYQSDAPNTEAIALSPDGAFLAAVIGQHVLVWETQHWKVVHKISYGVEYFHTVTFSPDSKQLSCICGQAKSALLLVRCKSWETKFSLRGHTQIVDKLNFSHDGKLIASADRHGLIKIHNAETGTLLCQISEPGKTHTDLTFHPTQNMLATARNDGAIIIYRLSA